MNRLDCIVPCNAKSRASVSYALIIMDTIYQMLPHPDRKKKNIVCSSKFSSSIVFVSVFVWSVCVCDIFILNPTDFPNSYLGHKFYFWFIVCHTMRQIEIIAKIHILVVTNKYFRPARIPKSTQRNWGKTKLFYHPTRNS